MKSSAILAQPLVHCRLQFCQDSVFKFKDTVFVANAAFIATVASYPKDFDLVLSDVSGSPVLVNKDDKHLLLTAAQDRLIAAFTKYSRSSKDALAQFHALLTPEVAEHDQTD